MSWEVRTMRSGTSFFNGTLYRKAFFRFWPIWAIYGIQWLLLIPMPLLTTALQGRNPGATSMADYLFMMAQETPPSLLVFGSMSAAVAGVICAMAVFAYLYSSRSACTMHALPLRRETLFVSHYLAGLSFLLLPHLAVYALTVAVEAALGCLGLWPLTQWLLCQSGMCLFFYSFAVFCAMFTGNLVALPLFYGILNFLAYALTSLAENVCYAFLFGFQRFPSALWEAVAWLTPWLSLADALHIDHYVDAGPVLAAPSTTAIYAAAGLVFAAAALLVYRVRHVESAGDVVAVKVVRPVFRYGFALCAGLTGGVWTSSLLMQDSTTALTFWVVFWGVVGCFAAEMLLKKSFRVLKAWKGSVALGAVMLLLCLSVSLDWYGYEDRVPASDQVESIEIYGLSSAPYDGADSSITLTTPENIQRVIQFHQMAVQMEDQQYDGQNTDGYLYVHLTYTLADGRVMERVYNNLPLREDDLGTEGTFANLANQLLSDRELVAEMYDFETVEQGRLVEAYLDSVWNTRTQSYETVYIDGSTQALYDAVKQDFAEGTIGIRYLLDNSQARLDNTCVTDLHFTVEVPQTASTPGTGDRAASEMVSYDWYITLTPNASHTLALLRELGALDETHIAPTYGEYLSDTETTYDGYRNPDGSIPEDILYDAPNTRTVS